MDILKAVLMARYHYTRAEVNLRIREAELDGSLPKLYEIAIIKLREEMLKNV